MLVSVVVPLFNEEEGVEHLHAALECMRRGIEALGHKVEFVFVDDGSTDGTSWQLSLVYRGRKDARVVAHRKNQGFGAAFRSGIAEARGAVLVCYDGDAPYPPEDGALLVEAVQGPEDADVATISPWAKGGRAEGIPFHRRLLSKGASRLYRFALRGKGQGLTCYTCSYRAYKGDVIRSVEFKSDDYLATAEILARCLLSGRRVIELSSQLQDRKSGHSKMKLFRTVRRHVGLIRKIAFGGLDPDWSAEPPPGAGGKDSAL